MTDKVREKFEEYAKSIGYNENEKFFVWKGYLRAHEEARALVAYLVGVLKVYADSDAGAVKLLAGFKANTDMRDSNSPAEKAIAIAQKWMEGNV